MEKYPIMKTKFYFTAKTILIGILLVVIGCNDDDSDMPENMGPDMEIVTVSKTTTYDLGSVAVPSISGKAIFTEFSDNTVTIDLELSNTPAGGQHPAHIHFNSAAEGGGIALTLGTVDGDTGKSSIMVTTLDDGTAIGYDDLINFDGYINVHLSAEELSTLVAQGDIGSNELTGVSQMYELKEKDVPGISGMVTFFERKGGNALARIELMNTPSGGIHPAHIHENDAATGGGIAFSFNPVDGDTGMSDTNVSQLDDGTPFRYADIEGFDGYINVHLSTESLATIVSQGNIGSNANGDTETAKSFDVGSSGSTAYTFTGGDLNNASNPDLTLKRGETYTFEINAPGHPFFIKTEATLGEGETFDQGVTGNGEETGTVTFEVPMDAPDVLYYICSLHSAMTGTLNIVD